MAIIQKNIKCSTNNFKEASDFCVVFKLLSDINNFRIFSSLSKYERLSDIDMANILDIPADLVKKHLQELERKRLLIVNDKINYSLNLENEKVQAFKNIII